MKTLQVKNGDIQLDGGGKLQFVKGTSKLLQDISLWLRETYGSGFTTPGFGSLLPGMIGQGITSSSIAAIQSEIQRIINLYQANQIQQLQNSQNLNQLSYWNKSEIIHGLESIQVLQGTGFVSATVSITTLNGSSTDINLIITPNGIQVQNNG